MICAVCPCFTQSFLFVLCSFTGHRLLAKGSSLFAVGSATSHFDYADSSELIVVTLDAKNGQQKVHLSLFFGSILCCFLIVCLCLLFIVVLFCRRATRSVAQWRSIAKACSCLILGMVYDLVSGFYFCLFLFCFCACNYIECCPVHCFIVFFVCWCSKFVVLNSKGLTLVIGDVTTPSGEAASHALRVCVFVLYAGCLIVSWVNGWFCFAQTLLAADKDIDSTSPLSLASLQLPKALLLRTAQNQSVCFCFVSLSLVFNCCIVCCLLLLCGCIDDIIF